MSILSTIGIVLGFLRTLFGWVGNIIAFIRERILRKRQIRKKLYEEGKEAIKSGDSDQLTRSLNRINRR